MDLHKLQGGQAHETYYEAIGDGEMIQMRPTLPKNNLVVCWRGCLRKEYTCQKVDRIRGSKKVYVVFIDEIDIRYGAQRGIVEIFGEEFYIAYI